LFPAARAGRLRAAAPRFQRALADRLVGAGVARLLRVVRPEFLLLLLFSITVNFAFGTLIIDGGLSRAQSRAILTIGIAFNLCLLGYFKYAGFFVANVDSILGLQWAVPSIVLPIGISFITFQKIAFLVDAHRGLVRNFTLLNYAFFVTFFPQLIAGPITHHSEIMPQIGPSQRRDLAADIA